MSTDPKILASRFLEATLNRWGTDEKGVEEILKEVHSQGIQDTFEMALKDSLGSKVTVASILSSEMSGAPLKKATDYFKRGVNTCQPTLGEIFVEGFLNISDLSSTGKKVIFAIGGVGITVIVIFIWPPIGLVVGAGLLVASVINGAITMLIEGVFCQPPESPTNETPKPTTPPSSPIVLKSPPLSRPKPQPINSPRPSPQSSLPMTLFQPISEQERARRLRDLGQQYDNRLNDAASSPEKALAFYSEPINYQPSNDVIRDGIQVGVKNKLYDETADFIRNAADAIIYAFRQDYASSQDINRAFLEAQKYTSNLYRQEQDEVTKTRLDNLYRYLMQEKFHVLCNQGYQYRQDYCVYLDGFIAGFQSNPKHVLAKDE